LLLRLPLDGVQGADAGQRLVCPPRVGEPSLKEITAGMGPTPDVSSTALVYQVVPGVPVGMEEPIEPLQERGRGVAGPTGGQVERGIRVGRVADGSVERVDWVAAPARTKRRATRG